MNLLDNIKEDIEKYIGLHRTPDSEFEIILGSMVSHLGPEIYLNYKRFNEELENAGVKKSEILKVCLMTEVTGFKELVSLDTRTQQADLDRFVMNAVRETGLNRHVVMELTRAIAKSLGIVCDIMPSAHDFSTTIREKNYAIPKSVYDIELNRFEPEFKQLQDDKKDVTEVDFSVLLPLVHAGIPKAKYYLGMGYLMMNDGSNKEEALALLEEAAKDGEMEAAAALGDYYYKKRGSDFWGNAYECYTGFGALALNENRRKAITNITNQKKFNWNMLLASAVLLVAMFITFILVPGSGIYSAHYVWGVICLLLQIAVFVVSVMHYRIRPYDSVYHVPVVLFIFWVLYMAIRLLF